MIVSKISETYIIINNIIWSQIFLKVDMMTVMTMLMLEFGLSLNTVTNSTLDKTSQLT